METGKQDTNSFHLAGIVPIAGQSLDYDMPWHDALMPIAPGYTALQHAVMECAYAGCETIWIVCHYDTQPLVRKVVGDCVQDPVWYYRKQDTYPSESRKLIPIYYVPIHPKDRDKRDCLSWSVLYGANTAYWVSGKLSKWVIPDKYYVSFPYGIYDNNELREHRKIISSKEDFVLSHGGKTVSDGLYLGFTFTGEQFKQMRANLRSEGTGIRIPGEGMAGKLLPVEERWSARFFSLDKVFDSAIISNNGSCEIEDYFGIDSWQGYCNLLSAADLKIEKPYDKILYPSKLNKIGEIDSV
tara:strand:+ start:2171 stop:3064 length:894 start_codon:yes stop_codon:yes gene_type:complete